MAAQTHIIGRQVLEIGVADRDAAHEAQERMSRVYRHEILPRLEQLFDRMVKPDVVLRLDRLEIDLGYIESERFEIEVVERVIRQVAHVVEDELHGIVREEVKGRRSKRTSVQYKLEDWLFFLKQGRFAWPSQPKDWDAWERNIIDLLDDNRSIGIRLHRLFNLHPQSVQRLLYQFSEPLVLVVARTLSPQWSQNVVVLERAMLSAGQGLPVDAGISLSKHAFWAYVLTILHPTSGINDGLIKLIDRIISFWEQTTRLPRRRLIAALISAMIADQNFTGLSNDIERRKADVIDALRHIELGYREDYKREIDKLDSQPEEQLPSLETDLLEEQLSSLETDLPEVDLQDDQLTDELESDGWSVPCAGVILLHPFLARLFEYLGLTQETAFVDKAAQSRAIHLIQYLATGKHDHLEPDLILAKVLCGMPIHQPIERILLLTEIEVQECDQLLEAVIKHWEALGDASAEGLQQAFLQRSGVLSHNSSSWQLNVEEKTEDILIGRLPWGIGLVKLPWMLEMMEVNWR